MSFFATTPSARVPIPPGDLAFGMMAKGWRSLRLDQIEPIAILRGRVLWRPIRRMLEVGAFGINSFVAPNPGDTVIEEHTEQALGHEEVYVVLTGHATFELDGDEFDAPAGTVIFIREPKVKRHAKATEPNTTVLAVGGPRGAAYEPSVWEEYFLIERHTHQGTGDYEADIEQLAAAVARAPEHPANIYDLACAEALAGRHEAAVAHLRRAIELQPDIADRARKDEDLVSLHERDDWPL